MDEKILVVHILSTKILVVNLFLLLFIIIERVCSGINNCCIKCLGSKKGEKKYCDMYYTTH